MQNIRDDFPIFKNHRVHYLDSAASTQKPEIVIDTLSKFYKESYANVHRGIYPLSEKATTLYESARSHVAKFLGVKPEEIIFLRNTTEALNLTAYSLSRYIIKKGDRILVTMMEHHSNFVPWQAMAKETGAEFVVIPVDFEGNLDFGMLEKELKKGVKIFAFTMLSNVLGTITPAKELIQLARKYGAITVLDGAQAVPHMKIDLEDLKPDFFAFSGHKIYGPSSIGVLYGQKELLERIPPFLYGGEMIKKVEIRDSSWADIPHKFEAGTPPIAEAIGLKSAIEYVERIGYRDIDWIESSLIEKTYAILEEIPQVEIYGPPPQKRKGVIAFNVKGAHPHDIAGFLGDEGVAIRAGHHCAEPLHAFLGINFTLRVSFGVYNTMEDVEAFRDALLKAIKVFT